MEIIAVLFSLICVYLTIKKNSWSWGVGLIGVFAYAYVFLMNGLYADFALQIFFIIQSIYGWINWVENKDIITHELNTSYLTIKEYLLYGCLIVLIYLLSIYILLNYTNSQLPYVDSFVSVLSLIANWLLAKRKIENWILWIIVNIVYIWLFYTKELYLSSGLYFIFLGMSSVGLYKWVKTYKNGRND